MVVAIRMYSSCIARSYQHLIVTYSLQAPDSLGVYEVRYYSSWLKEQYQPGHHRQCWVVGEVVVTAA